ncbi:MAG: hypothetical protein N2490_08870 [Ignavibacteria bacterium]|nr:hypothetical protein [Ignavibacteria bacterium]
MTGIILGSLVLSITHALIPNHWFPIAAISRSEKWSKSESIKITSFIGFLHTLSTIIFGILVGFIGLRLKELGEISEHLAPIVLILFGLFLILLQIIRKGKHQHHTITSESFNQNVNKSKYAIVTSLGIMMFFSPCIEIEAYYFTVGTNLGWIGIFILSIIYLTITLIMMVILVELARSSLEKLNKKLHGLDKYERAVNGVILIVLGIVQFIIKH